MVRYDYYCTDPDVSNTIGGAAGCGVGSKEVEHMGGGLAYMACVGAEELDLSPGRYVAVQANADRDDAVLGFGWLIEITTPAIKKALVIK